MQENAIALPPAPFLVRIAAMIYESLLVTAVVFVVALPFLYVVGTAESGWVRHVFQAYLLGILFAYFSAFWLRSGQTLAMKTWRIRLVDRNGGGRITFRQALLRFFLALFGLVLGGIGFWWALVDRDRQFLHDRIAGTRLVRVPRKA
jgi:uncharacterized RDD family membrane protein YckC